MLPLLKSTVKSSLIYSFGNLSTKIAGFILIPVYTKYLPLSDYGVLGLLEVVSVAIISIFGLSLYTAFFRWYFDKEFETRQKALFFTSTLFLTVITLLLVLLLYPASNFFSGIIFKQDRFTNLFNLMVITSAVQIVATMPSTLMRVQERPGLFIGTNIIRLLLTLVLTIILMVYYQQGLLGIFKAQMIANIIYIILLLPYIFRNFEYRFEGKALIEMLSFCLPLILASLSGIIISFTDKYFLNVMGSLANTGLYSFAFKISNTIYYLVVDSVNLGLAPIVFKIMYDKNSQRFYSKIITYLSFLVLVCIMGLSFFGKELIELISLNKAYYGAYKILPLLSFAAVFMMLRDAMVRALNIVKKSRVISLTIITVSFMNILLNYLLIPLFQTTGASVAYLLTQILAFLGLYYFAQKAFPINYEIKKIIIMLLLSTSLIGCAILLNNLSFILAIFSKLALLAAFPVILYFLDFYEPIELERIKQIITGNLNKEIPESES